MAELSCGKITVDANIDMQDDDIFTDICNIVVRNFDKLG